MIYIAECLECKKLLKERSQERIILRTDFGTEDIIDDLFSVTFDLFTESYGLVKKEADAPQVYVGETSSTLYKRSLEHYSGALRMDRSNFILKH